MTDKKFWGFINLVKFLIHGIYYFHHQETKPDTYRLFSLLRDNRQQQEHWGISVSSNKGAVLLAEPKEPEEKLMMKMLLIDPQKWMQKGWPLPTDGIDTWSEDSKEYMPGDQAWYTHFRIGRVAPERYEGSQFPDGEEAQGQFFRQKASPETATSCSRRLRGI